MKTSKTHLIFALVVSTLLSFSGFAETTKPTVKPVKSVTPKIKVSAGDQVATSTPALDKTTPATVDAPAIGLAPLEATESRDIAASLGAGGTIAREGNSVPLFKDEIAKAKEETSVASVTAAAPVSLAVPTSELLDAPKKETQVPWLRSILAFLFVSSLIVLSASYLRKKPKLFRLASDDSSIAIRQTIPMGLKRQIVAVDFEGARLLLGVSENRMQLLYAHAPASSVAVSPQDLAAPLASSSEEILQNLNESLENVTPIKKAPTLAERVAMAVKDLKPLHAASQVDASGFRAEAPSAWAKKRVH